LKLIWLRLKIPKILTLCVHIFTDKKCELDCVHHLLSNVAHYKELFFCRILLGIRYAARATELAPVVQTPKEPAESSFHYAARILFVMRCFIFVRLGEKSKR